MFLPRFFDQVQTAIPWVDLSDPRGVTVLLVPIALAIVFLGNVARPRCRHFRPGHRRSGVAQRRTTSAHNVLHLGKTAAPEQHLNLFDPRDQMLAGAAVDFERAPLLNGAEARLLPTLKKAVETRGDGHRVKAQTSLGEVIRLAPISGFAQDRSSA